MRHLFIIASIIFLTSPLFGNSHKGETLYGWETSSGVQLREFGDKDIHPQYKGDVENTKPNGLGIMTFPDGRKYVGEWKNGKRMVTEHSLFQVDLNMWGNTRLGKCGT